MGGGGRGLGFIFLRLVCPFDAKKLRNIFCKTGTVCNFAAGPKLRLLWWIIRKYLMTFGMG